MSKQATIDNWELESFENGTLFVTLFGNDNHYINETRITEDNIGDQSRVVHIKNVLSRTDVTETEMLELVTLLVTKTPL